uniref:PKS_ER domain-containing protein n=1 Tax=Rhabditophanes sp. KR3021 TaxID=114890 RepID=A0AC35TS94_9BILA
MPVVKRSNELLIKVKAASVNPIDVRMTEGYGNELLSKWRQFHESSWQPISRLPLIGGRDVSGEIVEIGSKVSEFKKGDQVIATVPGILNGSHAEYVLTDTTNAVRKPEKLSYTDAVSMVYTTATAWAALSSIGQLNPRNSEWNRVLIHGGSGGVGTSAIQLLKSWNIDKVVATSSAKNSDIIKQLGAISLDYNDKDIKEKIVAEGPFDVILSCADTDITRWSDASMGIWRNCIHVSVVSPMLKDTDRYGLPLGLLSVACKHFARSFESAKSGRWYSYAFFMPNKDCMNYLGEALESGKIKPIVERVMSFDQMAEAYDIVGKVHGRGKTVIDYEK